MTCRGLIQPEFSYDPMSFFRWTTAVIWLKDKTRNSLQIFCCTSLKYTVLYQKKPQKCFGISFLLPTCVASFCASIYYIPWLMGSLLAGILPFGISRLSETFREWKGIGSYFCHSAIVLVGRVSLGFKISSIMSYLCLPGKLPQPDQFIST